LTQLGNAERFVFEHGEKIRYCFAWKQWLFWDGKRWRRDETEQVHRLAVLTVRSIKDEAKKEHDDELRSKIEGHARRCESSYNL
jgi:putative DNA primase/helicase